MNDFFTMGGFGLYVWGAMGVVLVYILVEPLVLIMQRKAIIRSIRRSQRLQQRQERKQQDRV